MFAVAGFLATAIAIIALTIFYRDMVMKDIVIQGERENQLLAQTALNSVKNELITYLHAVNGASDNDLEKPAIPSKLDHAIQETLSNIYVARINIYSMDGRIIYSSKTDKVVQDRDNSGFVSAISGKVMSKLEYRDIFSLRNKESDIDNLVESYLPVRQRADSPILGVFEIYTDVNRIVQEVEHTEIMIVLGVVIILLLLYGLLMTIVRRAANTIEHQQSVIRERTHTLELLSSQLINSEEDAKREIAHDLHENIAQTLAGVKNVIESTLAKQPGQELNGENGLKQSITMLRDSIGEIRTLAMELRPPSLDDFGLIKTLDWLCRQYQLMYPQLRIETSFDLEESIISDTHKSIIYRVVQDTLESIARQGAADTVQMNLHKVGDAIKLVIEDNCIMPNNLEPNPAQTVVPGIPLYAMRKRTVLSGGIFSIERRKNGQGTVASSSWLAA